MCNHLNPFDAIFEDVCVVCVCPSSYIDVMCNMYIFHRCFPRKLYAPLEDGCNEEGERSRVDVGEKKIHIQI